MPQSGPSDLCTRVFALMTEISVAGALLLLVLLWSTGARADFDEVVIVGSASGWKCSGVAIAPRKILTAAHCLPVEVVGLGDGSAAPFALYDVASVERDPVQDIATVTLAADLPLPNFPQIGADPRHIPGVVHVVGFGAIDPDGRVGFGRKRARDLVVPGSLGCDAKAAARTGCRLGRDVLIENSGSSDACSGDSGGPLYIRDDESPTGWRVIAITSRALPTATRACGGGGIFSLIQYKRG